MINITEKLYAEIAQKTREAIDKKGFVDISIELDHSEDSAYYRFYLCAIIYRDQYGRIDDIVPVWWEFSSITPDKGEVLNDFSFNEIKPLIKLHSTSRVHPPIPSPTVGR